MISREDSNWSAFRTMNEYPEFDVDKALKHPDNPVYFTGETVSIINASGHLFPLTRPDPASYV